MPMLRCKFESVILKVLILMPFCSFDVISTVVALGSYRNQNLANTELGGFGSVHMRNCDVDEDGQLVCWIVHLAKIEDIIVHEDYLVGEAWQDVALVKLRDSVYSFNTSVESRSTNSTVVQLLGTLQVRHMCNNASATSAMNFACREEAVCAANLSPSSK